MYYDFELSFEYFEGVLAFELLSGFTEASKQTKWDFIAPALESAITLTEQFVDDDTIEDATVLTAWRRLIDVVVGATACQKIVSKAPARISIQIGDSIPEQHHELFQSAPWEIVIPQIASAASETRSQQLDEIEITLLDIRIADEGTSESMAGIEQTPASMDFSSCQDDGHTDGTTFPVWFGTNRCKYQAADGSPQFTGEMDENDVHYGKCEIWIPDSHRPGELKSPWYKRQRWLNSDSLRLERTMLLESLTESIYQDVDPCETTNHLLFIHGFNNSFQDAVLRAAQLGYDLGIDGATIAFSWPSRKLFPYISRYSGDGEQISACRKTLEVVGRHLSELKGTIHVVAHSMGNRLLASTWASVLPAIRSHGNLEVGQVIFAAPDVFQQAFRDDTDGIHDYCNRATLYANRLDFALGLSRILSRTPRAGILPPVMDLKGIDIVDVPFRIALLGHSYFANVQPMLDDLSALIFSASAPGEGDRKSLVLVKEERPYWQLSTA